MLIDMDRDFESVARVIVDRNRHWGNDTRIRNTARMLKDLQGAHDAINLYDAEIMLASRHFNYESQMSSF